MAPPYQLTPRVFAALTRIDQALGRLQGLDVAQPQPLLRKRSRVRTVQASAAIEGNRLSVEQVTAVLDGKRVLARPEDLTEIHNVNEAYGRLATWKSTRTSSLLAAHRVLMKGLMPKEGRFRTGGVGVFRGEKLTHLAPPAHLVSSQVSSLLRWVASGAAPPLIAGCVAHYELLFIHPFLDGNGRLARLWQQVIHRGHSPLLEFVPVESLIRDRQRKYYATLRKSDRAGDCTPFLEFCLEALADALDEFGQDVRAARDTAETRLARAREHFGPRWFARKDYVQLHVKTSTATASRDLADGVRQAQLETRGALRLTEYRFRPTGRRAASR